ncbi:MAG: hypothetical protein ACI4TA_12865, partial [Acetatifactor sp.]
LTARSWSTGWRGFTPPFLYTNGAVTRMDAPGFIVDDWGGGKESKLVQNKYDKSYSGQFVIFINSLTQNGIIMGITGR